MRIVALFIAPRGIGNGPVFGLNEGQDQVHDAEFAGLLIALGETQMRLGGL